MSITLELAPEVHARLAREAQAQGMPLEVYLRTLIERGGAPDGVPSPELEDFRATLDALARDSAKLPSVSSKHLRRDCIYQDHD